MGYTFHLICGLIMFLVMMTLPVRMLLDMRKEDKKHSKEVDDMIAKFKAQRRTSPATKSGVAGA